MVLQAFSAYALKVKSFMFVCLPFYQFHNAVIGQIHQGIVDGFILMGQPGISKELLQPVVLIPYPIQN